MIDDIILDKPYANKIELAGKHWSGKHKRVVKGITLVTLLWTEGQSHIPCDYRIYDKLNDKMSQKDHFRSMITESQERGLSPERPTHANKNGECADRTQQTADVVLHDTNLPQ